MTRLEKMGTAVAIVLSAFLPILTGCSAVPRSVYDFDDGTTQGWKVTAVFDDQGAVYTPFFPLSHFEAAQYPNSFPGGDPLNDKNGCLLIIGGQMGIWEQQSGFPSGSKYWEFVAYHTGLGAWDSTAWKGIKGVKVSVGDNFGAVPGQIMVNIGVRARVGGQDQNIAELDASGKPLFHPVNHQTTLAWSNLNAKLDVPANAEVYQVWIRFRGEWKVLYEGGLMLDQVAAVK